MLGWLEWRWLGGIYSPQPPKQPLGVVVVDGRTGQSGAPATSPNRRVRTQSTIGASSSSGTGQSGAAPDRYCSLSGVPLASALSSSRTVRTVAFAGVRCSRPLRW
jgi:hypothetical protein